MNTDHNLKELPIALEISSRSGSSAGNNGGCGWDEAMSEVPS
jgi:hypothetical protein